MASIPKRTEARIKGGLSKFKRVIKNAQNRDVNESDTVTILTDMLSEICGYDKYSEITREFAIRGTFCDLALTIDGDPVFLIEVKAIGITLRETHLKQAIGYAASEGIEWVILTNGDHWQAHRVIFGKPIKTEIGFDFHFTEASSGQLVDFFFLLSKEGVKKSAIDAFHEESQLTSRYAVAAALQTEPVLAAVRRQLRMIGPKLKVTTDDIGQTIRTQVLKREVAESEEIAKAKKRLTAAARAKKRASGG